MGTNNKKSTQAVLAALLAAGMQKHYPAGSSLTVDGGLLTLVQIVAQLSQLAALLDDVDTARAALQAKVAVEQSQAPAILALMRAIVRVVRGTYGNQPDVLADFGIKPIKARAPLTVQQKAAAAAKRKATRAARGTKGSKAVQAIHGNVVDVVVTPVTAVVQSSGGTSAPAGSTAGSAPATPAPHG